jgi:16S rRNA C967 or C1407 C5-methylase (RsmB/RsmF family)
MDALRAGGRLIYSTCSLEAEENETVVAEVLSSEKGFSLQPWGDQIQALEGEGILRPGTADRLAAGNFLRTFPGLYSGDGFFAACLTRQ